MSSTGHHKAARWGDLVVGPFEGHHRVSYAVRTSHDSGCGSQGSWVKVCVPQPGVFRYDRRCFASEEGLLKFLAGRVPRIPSVIDPDPEGPVHSFIQGRTLGRVSGERGRVDIRFVDQIMDVFESLTRIDAREISVERACGHGRRTHRWGDSQSFYRGLLEFIRTSGYETEVTPFRALLADFGVSMKLLKDLERRSRGLTDRPFSLLHGDLHRENMIVDADNNLWTIDWELARIGDPLYELATHLYLMRYPEDQERVVVDHWKIRVAAAHAGAADGADADLPHYLAFKRVQSAHTDLMRAGRRLALLADDSPELIRTASVAADVIVGVLKAVEGEGLPLEKSAPSVGEAQDALLSWRRDFGAGVVSRHDAMAGASCHERTAARCQGVQETDLVGESVAVGGEAAPQTAPAS
ncbi:phosphotransferase [Streptomyces sp. NPDC026673]|uniref:phosphotransferase n=1 Tax=Streptomyces sp. NPDC026673 TaxID=3155724 RepID=UPI0033D123DD